MLRRNRALMKYYMIDDKDGSMTVHQTFLDYIEVNYRNGNYNLSPVIPKINNRSGSNASPERPEQLKLVTSLKLKSSLQTSNNQKLTASEIIDRHLTSLSLLSRDSERGSTNIKNTNKNVIVVGLPPVCNEEDEKVVLDVQPITENVNANSESSVKIESINIEESVNESPVAYKESFRIDNLVSYRQRPEDESNKQKPQERARSEQTRNFRNRSFNKNGVSPDGRAEPTIRSDGLAPEHKVSVHKFEIAEDSESSIKQNSKPSGSSLTGINKSSFERLIPKTESNNYTLCKHPYNTFSKLERELNFGPNRNNLKPSSILVDLRDSNKINYERKMDYNLNGYKLGINLPSRLKYANILSRPTDTVVKKFIELGKRNHLVHAEVSRQSKILANPSDTLRQQLYSNSVLRYPAHIDRKKPLGLTSGLLIGSKPDDLLGRRSNLGSNLRWPNKHH